MRFSCVIFLLIAIRGNTCQASEDIRFEAIIVPSSIAIPRSEAPDNTSVLLALKIVNMGDKSVLINRYATAVPKLRTKNGAILKADSLRNGGFPPERNDFVFLDPHCTMYIQTECSLWKAAGNTLEFRGENRSGEVWWLGNISFKPSKYMLFLVYQSEKDDFLPDIANDFHGATPWYGLVETKPISIELTN